MEILELYDLDYSHIHKKQWTEVIDALARSDWKAAQVKKMVNSNLYRAKLNDSDRLIFKILKYGDKKYILLLEVIYQHNYQRSANVRFGNNIDENSLSLIHVDEKNDNADDVVYINNEYKKCVFLNKFISFDHQQLKIYSEPLPLILIGSAGSGKTALLLEKIKHLKGDILYVTQSSFLVENSRSIYYSHNYKNEQQNIDFLSFYEFLCSFSSPQGKDFLYRDFHKLISKYLNNSKIKDTHKIYEEFRGVITGNDINVPYLSRNQYLELGLKQSIFNSDEREVIYNLFERYLDELRHKVFYDNNIISHEYKKYVSQKYDWVIIDEVQDLTNIQTYLILSTLRNPGNFLLCGDSNQIVHPNFFSWSHIKTLFFENKNLLGSKEIIRILHHNYRNSLVVTDIANRLLRVKNARFGSIDKESNYLVESLSKEKGKFEIYHHDKRVIQEFDEKTKKSTKFAVIVMRSDDKVNAKKFFHTPLVFSIEEAKGLEYQNVIIYNFISTSPHAFNEIIKGVTRDDLQKELDYSRAKDKKDKSLEVYKFYINAFYVAITRAVENVYLIEERVDHDLFKLLNLTESTANVSLKKEESNWQDWQKEASKLEMQGKLEQAEDIRRNVLQLLPVPWEVIQYQEFEKLKREVLTFLPHLGKKQKQLLFEFALIYNINYVYPILAKSGLSYAKNPTENENYIISKHYLDYETKNFTILTGMIQKYGVDFRHRFNQTPLMVSAILGNAAMANLLIQYGAKLDLLDNLGRTPLQIALSRAITDKIYAQNYIGQIYATLAPPHISILIGNSAQKIDAQKVEFFILNLIVGIYHYLLGLNPGDVTLPYFTAQELEGYFAIFPHSILPDFRKKKAYISGILSKNEVDSNAPYGKKIFVRLNRGIYMMNPLMKFQSKGEWKKLEDLAFIHFWSDENNKKNFDKIITLNKRIEDSLQEKFTHASSV